MAKKGAGGEESVVVPGQTEEAKQGPPRKRNPCPGIRCVGGRIYDPENGKTCHQVSACRRASPPSFWICRGRIWLTLCYCFRYALAVSSEDDGLRGGLHAAPEEGALSNPLLPQVPVQQVNDDFFAQFQAIIISVVEQTDHRRAPWSDLVCFFVACLGMARTPRT